MAYRNRYGDDERYRGHDDRGGYAGRGRDRGDDGGIIARRGFGNEAAGYDRGDRWTGRDDPRRYDRGGRIPGKREPGYAPDYYVDESRVYGAAAGYPLRERTFAGPYGYGVGDRGRDARGHGDDRGFLERAGDEIASWFGSEEAERRRRRDALHGDEGAQHHRGRGPRGYRRSDERIHDDVNDRLTDDPYIDASDMEVRVSQGEVTLSGTVESRFAKRRAEDIAESVSGVTNVQNDLRVRERAGRGAVHGSRIGAADILADAAAATTGATGADRRYKSTT